MDPKIGWYQPETEGPARETWIRIWAAQQLPTPTPTPTAGSSVSSQSNSPGGSTSTATAAGPSTSTGQGQPGIGPGINRNNHWNRMNDVILRKDNRARTFGLGVNQNVKLSHNNGCPWLIKGKTYSTGIIGLHEEIEDFFEYMSPSIEEHGVRMVVVDRLRTCITKLWPHCQVEVFGSYRTGLYLPTSDIDVQIMGVQEIGKHPMLVLERALIRDGIADPSTTLVLDKATVPLVKLIEKFTDVKVDISFNMTNGVRSAKLIQKFVRHFPVLPKLILVLKQFLLQRDLNQVFTGGISSYSLILMIVNFLQLHERKDAGSAVANLGVLLIGFLELFGRLFNYWNVGIRIRDGGWYLPKAFLVGEMQLEGKYIPSSSVLCIEDPLTPGNDIGRSSYGALDVKQAFDYAFITLQQGVNHCYNGVNNPNEHSILGRVVRITDEVVEYRAWLRGVYATTVIGPDVLRSLQNFSFAENDKENKQNESSTSKGKGNREKHNVAHGSGCFNGNK